MRRCWPGYKRRRCGQEDSDGRECAGYFQHNMGDGDFGARGEGLAGFIDHENVAKKMLKARAVCPKAIGVTVRALATLGHEAKEFSAVIDHQN
mmetsp:Transcript_9645/g.24189  ORF Transcript_9645/g.24189 Transcript_9645/m.24189 type:complete len:93 (+) Transcript_9645:333-611(+)